MYPQRLILALPDHQWGHAMLHDPLILYIALLAIPIVALTGAAVVKRFYIGPPHFKEPEYFADHNGRPFVDSLRFDLSIDGNNVADVATEKLEGWRNHAVGSVGELLTALIMIERGWRQLPSQPTNGGIDGIFFRRVDDRSGAYRFCLTETKASTKGHADALRKYDKDSNWLSDDHVRTKLDELQRRREGSYLAEDIDTALRSALNQQPKYLTKMLFVHGYPDRETLIFKLNSEGAHTDAPEEVLGDARYLNFLEAMEIGIARLAKNVGVESRLIGVINPTQVKLHGRSLRDNTLSHRRAKTQDTPVALDYQI